MGLLINIDARSSQAQRDALASRERQLSGIRAKLQQRVLRKRLTIQIILEHARVPLAELASTAPDASLRAFLVALQRGDREPVRLLELARALGVPPFALATALGTELSEYHRTLLTPQLHGFDALQRALHGLDSRGSYSDGAAEP